MHIANRSIGRDHAPFIIAEMSGNHNQSLERALEIVEAAAATGAHAIKLQTYTADTMTLPLNTGDFFIDDERSLWHGHSLHELYQIAHTPWDWHAPILERAKALGIIAFSTPFDETAVDFLETLDTPCYKIASFENADLPLIRNVAATGKPMIISTGMVIEPSRICATCSAARSACPTTPTASAPVSQLSPWARRSSKNTSPSVAPKVASTAHSPWSLPR